MKPTNTIRPGAFRKQRGVAIIMTLGILSLLLILAISFSFSTRTERNAASANSDLVRARLFCESGVDRAIAYLSNSYPAFSALPTTAAERGNLFPAVKASSLFIKAPTGNGWSGRYVAACKDGTAAEADGVETALSAALQYTSGSSQPFFTPADSWIRTGGGATWLPIRNNATTKVIGRVAYVIIDESGKLDPNCAATLAKLSTGTASGITPGTRIGQAPKEINVASSTFGSLGFASAPLWVSWQHMVNGAAGVQTKATPVAGAYSSVTGTEDIFQIFSPYSYDPEAWYDFTTQKDYSRLNLARADWTGVTATSLSSGTKTSFWDTTKTPAVPSTTEASSIPCLATMKNAAGASVSSQVAANIIDYCDTDNKATTDFVAGGNPKDGSYTKATCTYMGNEKVPYIYEVTVHSEATVSDDGDRDAPTYTYDLYFTAAVKLVNIYKTAAPASPATLSALTVDLRFSDSMQNTIGYGDYGTNMTIDDADASVYGIRFNLTPPASMAASSYSSGLQKRVHYQWSTRNGDAALPVFKASSVCALLTTSEGVADYANVSASEFDLNNTIGSPGNDIRDYDFQAYDPRSNLDANTEWKREEKASTDAGKFNSSVGAPAGAPANDKEAGADPTTWSTAYIRNEPMKSLWELGCISRGEKFCTINLKKFSTTASGKYTDGDANILDQAKLQGEALVRGKVNVNSPSAGVWKGLVSNDVKTGGTLSNTTAAMAGTTAIATAAPPTTASASYPYTSRGEAAEKYFGSAPYADATKPDAAQEELIGKTAALLTTRQNYFSILVTAQSLQEVPDTVPGSVTCGGKSVLVTGEQKMLAIVYRDAYTNKFRIEKLSYLNE